MVAGVGFSGLMMFMLLPFCGVFYLVCVVVTLIGGLVTIMFGILVCLLVYK